MNHVKKLADGSIVPCNCAICRTSLSGKEILNPIQDLPTFWRGYLFLAFVCIVLTVAGTYLYVYTR